MSADRVVYTEQVDPTKLASYGYEFGAVYGGQVYSLRDLLDPHRLVPSGDPLFERIIRTCLKGAPPPPSPRLPVIALLMVLAWAATVAPALIALAEAAP